MAPRLENFPNNDKSNEAFKHLLAQNGASDACRADAVPKPGECVRLPDSNTSANSAIAGFNRVSSNEHVGMLDLAADCQFLAGKTTDDSAITAYNASFILAGGAGKEKQAEFMELIRKFT